MPAIATPPRKMRPAKRGAALSPPLAETSQCDHFKIPPSEKISVQRQKENEIYAGDQQIERERQQIESDRHYPQPRCRRDHLSQGLIAFSVLRGIAEGFDRRRHAVEKKAHDQGDDRRKQQPTQHQNREPAQQVDQPIERPPGEQGRAVKRAATASHNSAKVSTERPRPRPRRAATAVPKARRPHA